jgi:hypothetical protein
MERSSKSNHPQPDGFSMAIVKAFLYCSRVTVDRAFRSIVFSALGLKIRQRVQLIIERDRQHLRRFPNQRARSLQAASTV